MGYSNSFSQSYFPIIHIIDGELFNPHLLNTPKLFYPSSDSVFTIHTETPLLAWRKAPNANGYTIYINEVNEKNEKNNIPFFFLLHLLN
ncbi:MAG: hypothetical protein H6613_18405 [Ignavibacteriales bacterium]|nr:hypothetical protein [Ignavibacteriales bacterium]